MFIENPVTAKVRPALVFDEPVRCGSESRLDNKPCSDGSSLSEPGASHNGTDVEVGRRAEEPSWRSASVLGLLALFAADVRVYDDKLPLP